MPKDERAQCCWALANSYHAAASHLLARQTAEIVVPSLFLALHALELHLKAFLVSDGICDKQLRSIGHDLLACLRECKQRGFARHVALTWVDQMQIARANAYYKTKELEYFEPRAKRIGSLARIAGVVDRVSKGVFNPITESTFRALSKQAT